MKNRPLCSACLGIFLVIVLLVCVGKGKVIKELRPSPLMQATGEGDRVEITGQVYKKELKSDYQILYLKNNSMKCQQQMLQESKIILYDRQKKSICLGNTVHASGKLSFYESPRNPGNFDQKAYYQRQDIHGAVWAEEVNHSGGKTWNLRERLYRLRQKWKKLLYTALGKEKGALLQAMMLGERWDMDAELQELYRVNGIGHILAISGLHLSFVGIGLYRILRRITGSYTFAGLSGIAFLGLYILMIGGTVSAIRALVMFLFRVGADMTGRHYDAPTACAAAAVVVLVWRPLYLYDGGFYLSFGAVLGILLILPLFHKWRVQPLAASLSITLFILPVQLYYFYEFAPYSTLLNLVVIPLMSALLFLGIAGSALFLVLPLPGELLLSLCTPILNLYESGCRLAVSLPGARIVTGAPKWWQIVGYYAGMTAALLLGYRYRRYGKWFVGTVLLCAGLLFLPAGGPGRGELQVTMLDVGQGDCIFLKSPSGTTYLFDGGSSDVKKVGQYRIEPFLKHGGIRTLDYVFLSHGDSDHISGVGEMLKRQEVGVAIRNLVLPVQELWDESLKKIAAEAGEQGIRVLVMEGGQQIPDDQLTFYCLQPDAGYAGEPGNEASLVMAVGMGDFDMLLTGDVEGDGEKLLQKNLNEYHNKGRWEVLKVAHHGSKNSTAETFLAEMKPLYGIISAGKNNRYGHPHQETLNRLKEIGCNLYTTADGGAITFVTDGKKMNIAKQLN